MFWQAIQAQVCWKDYDQVVEGVAGFSQEGFSQESRSLPHCFAAFAAPSGTSLPTLPGSCTIASTRI